MRRVAYSSPQYVAPLRSRVGPRLVLTLILLYVVWFSVVLLGEQQAWSDNPQAWAGARTVVWAWLGLVVFLLAALYFLILLVRREVPAKTYILQPPAGEGRTASFLQAPAEGQTQAPPPERPPQP